MSLSRPQQIIGALLIILLAAGSALVYRQREAGTAALVNGERIWMQPITARIETLRANDPYRFRRAAGQREEARVRKLLLDERIKHKLIAQGAAKAGVKITEAEIDRVLTERKKLFSSDSSEGAFTNAIAKDGLTEDTFRSRIHETLAQLKIRIKLAKAVTVSETEIQSYIKYNSADFKGPVEQVKLSVVTTDTQATTQKFLKGLKKERDFRELAEAMSLPIETAWYPTTWLDAPIAKAIASAPVGKHTNSIPNPDNSVSIYRLEERQTRQSQETEIPNQVRAKLLREKQQQAFPQWVDSLVQSADIQANI